VQHRITRDALAAQNLTQLRVRHPANLNCTGTCKPVTNGLGLVRPAHRNRTEAQAVRTSDGLKVREHIKTPTSIVDHYDRRVDLKKMVSET
jgi:hypothetical protein